MDRLFAEPMPSAHPAEVLSAIPGRARFRHEALTGPPSLASRLEADLKDQPGIREVHANPATARILVRFDPALSIERIHLLVSDAIRGMFAPTSAAAPPGPTTGAEDAGWGRELAAGAIAAAIAAVPLGVAGGIAVGVVAGCGFRVARIVSAYSDRVLSDQCAGEATSVLLRAVRPHRRRLVKAIAIVCGSVVAGFARILLVGTTMDTLIAARAPRLLAALGLGVAGSVVVQVGLIVVATAAYAVLKHRAQTAWAACGRRAQLDILVELCKRIEGIDPAYLQAHPPSELLAALRGSVATLERAFDGLFVLVELGANTVALTLAIILAAPSIAWIALIPLGVMVWQARTFYPAVQRDYERAYGRDETVDRMLGELVDGIATIKSFNLEDHYLERLRRVGAARVRASSRAASTALAYPLRLEVTTLLGISAVVVTGTFLLAGRSVSAGAHMALMMYAGHLFFPFAHLGQTIDSVQRGLAALGQLHRLENLPRETSGSRVLPTWRASDAGNPIGEVRFEHVTYSYPGAGRVLHDVSLQFQRGTITGIVGPTGSGKSTVARLLLGYYAPDAGTIALEGEPLEGISKDSLRNNIAVVDQDSFLFDSSVYENIAIGRNGAQPAQVEHAARLAAAHDFILGLPRGYHTRVGGRGSALSGGQRQRLTIARAFLKDAPILVLDEATASLDTRTEREILDALRALATDRIVIMIAHRLSTMRIVDDIYVINDGRVVERGSHALLISSNGLYHALWKSQHDSGSRA